MEKYKHRGIVINRNNDIIEVKVTALPKISSMAKPTKLFIGRPTVKMYRQSLKKKRGILGIGYKPSYYIGIAQIMKQKDSDVFVLKQANTANQILNAGDKIVFEANASESGES